ncbi:MAG: MMPL family transporter [Methylibium sp.]|uniref:MMPL family transporter n=1 Tax=Methylibium sp. TaxID=2067992 RepID=UPI001825710E|nr:MMPL family transporter [Methylibium sp.]MBA3598072.1 MMPL family transporter [Methylibium sp.]
MALLIMGALQAVGGFFALGLHLNNAPEVYYPSDAPAVLLRDELRREFPSDEVLTVLFQGDKLYSAGFLKRLDALAGALEGHPLVDRVTTVTTLEKISGTDDGFSVAPLLESSRLKDASSDELRRRVLEDRFAPDTLASSDGTSLAIAVRPKPLTDSAQRLALKTAVAAAIDEAGLRPWFVGDAGPVSMDVAQLESVLDDSLSFVPLTVAIGLLLLWWVVGRVRPVLIGAMAMSSVVLPTIGAIAASGQPYTMATAILPSLLAAYTLATLLHFYAGVQRAHAAGLRRNRSIDRALTETRKPGAYNVLTTGAGLLSLLLVPIPPVQVFGVAGAFGTVLVFVTVFFLVPPMLRRWDTQRWPSRSSGMGRFGRLASRLALFSLRHPKAVIGGAIVLCVASFPLATQVRVESDILAFFKPDHPLSTQTELIESKLSGVTSLEISLTGSGRDSLKNVDSLRSISDFQQWLEQQPEVDRAVSMVDLIEEMHWAMNDEQAAFRALPGNDRLLSQYLLVYDGRDLYELVNRDFQRARIVLSLNVHGTQGISQVIERIRERNKAQPLPGVEMDIGGHGRLFADQVDLLVQGQLNSFAGAFLQIFILMTLLWRSPVAAALCIVPNLAPLFFVFVLMGATGIPLDLATVMIASLVLGITIDDTIHLYHGYRNRLKAGAAPVFAIARSFESSGRAVLATSLLLIAQFALLAASDFIPTSNFGLLTAVGLAAGQLFELLVLPALLLVARRRGPAGASPEKRAAPAPAIAIQQRRVLVCRGRTCNQAGAAAVWRRLRDERRRLDLHDPATGVLITKTSCLGPCRLGPVLQVFPEGVYYCRVDEAGIDRVIGEHLVGGRVVGELALSPERSA